MMSALEHTVASLVPTWPLIDAAKRTMVVVRCARLVRLQISRGPSHIRLGFFVLFVLYRCALALRFGFGPSAEARARMLAAFSDWPLPGAFAVERLLRSSTLLFYFEQPEILQALGEQSVEERQRTFRMKRVSEGT